MSYRSKSLKKVRDIKRHTRRNYSSEEKIRIVLEDCVVKHPLQNSAIVKN